MSKLTSKRQVTVPQSVCEALGLKPGDHVEVFERDGVAHIVKMEDKSLAGHFAYLTQGKRMPAAEDIKKSIKLKAAKRYIESNGRG